MLKLTHLTVEAREKPLGVESEAPRFGWQTLCDTAGYEQAVCRVTAATRPELLDAPDLWDSGELTTARSENIAYAGKPLPGAAEVFFRVRVRGSRGETAFADSSFETALRDEDKKAAWIGQKKHRPGWSPYFRKAFSLPKRPVKARLYVAGLGYGETTLNGQRVTKDVLEPAMTNFETTVLYAAYDVTQLLACGENVLGVQLGCGFYNQDRVWLDGTLYWGTPCLWVQLDVTLEDGTTVSVLSDETWTTDYSPITVNSVYGGEIYDARLEQPGWNEPGFDDSDWKPAVRTEGPGGALRCREIPPIRRVRRVYPKSVRHLHEGEDDQTWIIDMGENFAGWAAIRFPFAPAGAEIVLRFAEITKDGSLDFTSCGTFHTCALQQDIYIAAGKPGGESWEPRFTFHGFRYIEVTGINIHSTELPEDLLTVYAVNTDLSPAGSFHCDYEPLNQLQTLGLRTLCSNYHGIPEDCPIREKCGWLGDAQLVSDTAMLNFDMQACYEKYMEDIASSREIYGDWTMIAPGKRTCGFATPLWGCAQVTIPWNLYLYYNDRRILEHTYPDMKAWVAHEKQRSDGLIITQGLGDWCPPGGHDNPERIPVAFSSTAEFFHVASLTAKVGRILGDDTGAAELEHLADKIAEAINTSFLDRSVPTYGTMGADGCALRYGFCPEALRSAIAEDCLSILNNRCGGAHYTGIFGNKVMAPAMTDAGFGSEMLDTFFSTETPSFQTMMDLDAGSLWESYDDIIGQRETFTTGRSLNHPMHFAFGSWFYTHLAGLQPMEEAPGFKRFRVRPYPTRQIRRVEAAHTSPYGTIALDWSSHTECFTGHLTVPANTEALCEFPMPLNKAPRLTVRDGEDRAVAVEAFNDNGRAMFTLPGGTWAFTVRWAEEPDLTPSAPTELRVQ